MINGFNMNGAPSVGNNQEVGVEHNIAELQSFSADRISKIDKALNDLGIDLEVLGNLIDIAKEDGEVAEVESLVDRLKVLTTSDTPIELKACIQEFKKKFGV